MVLANSPESGRILSMRMSRFSGYSSGASTTGQRSCGKSKTRWKHGLSTAHKDQNSLDLRNQSRLRTSAQCFEEGVDLFLPDSAGAFLPKQEVREQQVQSLYGNVLEATFLATSEVGVHVRAQEIR